jgi:hypothetical protein
LRKLETRRIHSLQGGDSQTFLRFSYVGNYFNVLELN